MNWTEDLAREAVALWERGTSGTVIARRLGMTRGQVLGKLNRMGYMRSGGGGRSGRRARSRCTPRITPAPQPKPKPEIAALPLPPLNLTLGQLTECDCKWPLNDGGPFLFCGRAVKPGGPYCSAHAAMAVNRHATERVRRKAGGLLWRWGA